MPRLVVIVGAGIFGATLAERLAEEAHCPVTVIDKRSHTGGNCHSAIYPNTEVEYHTYGSHIFHTSREDVWAYISRFTEFNAYRHHVYTTCRNRVYSMPINLDTINSFYGFNLKPFEVPAFLEKERKNAPAIPRNLEEKAVSLIGRPLYEAFIKGYTQKQWEKNPTELSPDIITRLPVRHSYNNRYFADTWEGIPLDGYGRLFDRMLSHPLITVCLNTPYRAFRKTLPAEALVVYTGAIDEYFDYSLGRLEWRTLDFEYEIQTVEDYQGTSVMNYADADVPYTRIHEFKHFHPERASVEHTLICREYSRFAKEGDEPFYPVNTPANVALYEQYRELARREPHVVFGGRLGAYRYLDMDATIEAALQCYAELKETL